MAFPDVQPPLTPPQPIDNWQSPIGGLAALGDDGHIILSTLVSPVVTRRVDVIAWHISMGYSEHPLAKGGMMGATSSRRTGFTYVWEAEIAIDFRLHADRLFRQRSQSDPWKGLTVQAWFKLGTQTLNVRPRYYWLPRCRLDSVSPVLDAGDKRRVRTKLVGCANSHMFLLPEQGDPQDPATYAGAYNAWLALHPYI